MKNSFVFLVVVLISLGCMAFYRPVQHLADANHRDSTAYYPVVRITDSTFLANDTIVLFQEEFERDNGFYLFYDHTFRFQYVSHSDTTSTTDWSTGMWTCRITVTTSNIEGSWQMISNAGNDSLILKLCNGTKYRYKMMSHSDSILWVR